VYSLSEQIVPITALSSDNEFVQIRSTSGRTPYRHNSVLIIGTLCSNKKYTCTLVHLYSMVPISTHPMISRSLVVF